MDGLSFHQFEQPLEVIQCVRLPRLRDDAIGCFKAERNIVSELRCFDAGKIVSV
jgi:hypothetical protein